MVKLKAWIHRLQKKTMREMSRPKMGMMRKMRSIKTMAREMLLTRVMGRFMP